MIYRPVSDLGDENKGKYWDTLDYSAERINENYGPDRRKTFTKFVKKSMRVLPKGTWLDIGCGVGHLVAAAQEFGWEATGLDVAPQAVEIARTEGLHVTLGRFPATCPGNNFNVISAMCVLEYIHEPKSFLTQCYRRLAPGGVITLKLKNLNFWKYAERFYRDNSGIWSPQDIRTYSPCTASQLLGTVGFHSVRVFPWEVAIGSAINLPLRILGQTTGIWLSPNIAVVAKRS